ncbi:Pv-fam-b protein [Plasmodium cynomolgi strain B]|uniref:Pv-fam-b protein n=1 Tax=Plasmodium cynomolgi (strain B) TaxID=1120755 RepID=K6V705_PLACD|nr:Pv-fam-b protein [Plasmodium cynomolgi strain B]GAB64902.1 Pv-fam-b protein [Plasmodium cynomolgi strain B]
MNSAAATSQPRTSRLLIAEIDTEFESLRDLEFNLWKNKERNRADQSDVETAYEESLSNDVKKVISLQGGENLSYYIVKHILEKIENKGILKCLKHEEEIEENQEQLNLLKQKILDSKMNNTEDLQKMIEGLKKINMMNKKLTKLKLMNAEVLKMIDNQKKLREDGGFVQTKLSNTASPALDGMKRISENNKTVRNPIHMPDSKNEKKKFKKHRHMDECQQDPNISKKKSKMIKFIKYYSLFSLSFVIIVSKYSLFGYVVEPIFMFAFAVASILLIFYILMKVLRYDLKSRGIRKPRFKDYMKSFIRSIK